MADILKTPNVRRRSKIKQPMRPIMMTKEVSIVKSYSMEEDYKEFTATIGQKNSFRLVMEYMEDEELKCCLSAVTVPGIDRKSGQAKIQALLEDHRSLKQIGLLAERQARLKSISNTEVIRMELMGNDSFELENGWVALVAVHMIPPVDNAV